MNSETFAQFIKTPAYLYRISYQELKSLVVQYPYCQNLRYLLLKKSQVDQHPEYERNLQMAATYSNDRVFLYEQLYSNDAAPSNRESNVVIEDELLELKEIDTLDLKPQKEVLLAETKEDATLQSNIVPPVVPIVDLPQSDILEVMEGDLSSDELPDDLDASLDELFEDVLNEETISSNVDLTGEAHQISEVMETKEEEELILLDNVPQETTDNLDITEELEEDDIPEVLAEASSDDIEDLFADDAEIELPTPTPLIENNSSIGLDVEGDLMNTEEPASDFMMNVTTGIGAVSIASVVADSNEEEIIEEAPSNIVDLKVEKTESDSATMDIADLTPVSQESSNEEEEEEFETETELISPQSSFSNWLKQFNSPQISVQIEDLDEKNEKKKVNYTYELVNGEWKQIKTKVKKKKKKSKAELIAAESVKLSKDVATETLAQLLEKQEHYSKAIKMYERLRLENPEKSDYFASKIESLQLKL